MLEGGLELARDQFPSVQMLLEKVGCECRVRDRHQRLAEAVGHQGYEDLACQRWVWPTLNNSR